MSVLEAGRARAEARMTETVQIGIFVSGTDPDTLDAIRTLVTERYAGLGRIKYETLTVSDSDTSSQTVGSQTPMLSIPTGSPLINEGDEVVVTASRADHLLIGRRYTVEGAPQSGQTTSHRYPLKELS
ncbi:DUF6093 family protein [Microbacterium sp. NPDC078814]|uniref:DUF6093 family protein n=1 Tax=Microbacterium sp. NPDC078814 TaxID=3154767 RepID=UPI00344FE03F